MMNTEQPFASGHRNNDRYSQINQGVTGITVGEIIGIVKLSCLKNLVENNANLILLES